MRHCCAVRRGSRHTNLSPSTCWCWPGPPTTQTPPTLFRVLNNPLQSHLSRSVFYLQTLCTGSARVWKKICFASWSVILSPEKLSLDKSRLRIFVTLILSGKYDFTLLDLKIIDIPTFPSKNAPEIFIGSITWT